MRAEDIQEIVSNIINQPALPNTPMEMPKEEVKFTSQLHAESELFAKAKLCREIHYKEMVRILAHPTEENTDPLTLELLQRQIREKSNKSDACKSTHVFITVNPKEDDHIELMRRVSKCCLKAWVKSYLYSIEQRSTDISTNFHGFHSHILLERGDKSPAEMRKEITNTFKTIVGTNKAIDFKWVHGAAVDNMRAYIQGTKKNPDKQSSLIRNEEWRKLHGYKPFYSSVV